MKDLAGVREALNGTRGFLAGVCGALDGAKGALSRFMGGSWWGQQSFGLNMGIRDGLTGVAMAGVLGGMV